MVMQQPGFSQNDHLKLYFKFMEPTDKTMIFPLYYTNVEYVGRDSSCMPIQNS